MKHQLKQSYSIQVCWCSLEISASLFLNVSATDLVLGVGTESNRMSMQFLGRIFVVKNMVNQSRTRQKTFHKGASDDLPELIAAPIIWGMWPCD